MGEEAGHEFRHGQIPLPKLKWEEGNQKRCFDKWKMAMDSFFVINKTEEQLKWHYIMVSTGDQGMELFQSWNMEDADKQDSSKVFAKFEEYMTDTANMWVARLELCGMMQATDQSVKDFMLKIKTKANEGQFEGTKGRDRAATFQLIRGTQWPGLRKKLIAEGNGLEWKKAAEMAVAYEASLVNSAHFDVNKQKVVELVNNHTGAARAPCRFCRMTHPPRKCPAWKKTCIACKAVGHFAGSEVCKQRNRQPVAPQETAVQHGHRQPARDRHRQVKQLDCEWESPTGSPPPGAASTPWDMDNVSKKTIFRVNDVSSYDRLYNDMSHGMSQIMCKLSLECPRTSNVYDFQVKSDTGANCNVLPYRCLKQLYPNVNEHMLGRLLNSSSCKLTAVNGTELKQEGVIGLKCKFEQSDWRYCKFFVVKTVGTAILSCQDSIALGIVSVCKSKNVYTKSKKHSENDKIFVSTIGNETGNPISNKSREPNKNNLGAMSRSSNYGPEIENVETLMRVYPECFKGLGKLPGRYHIQLRPDSRPVVAAPRKYPINLREEICAKLEEMRKLGVIEKVDDNTPSEWVNSLAFSRKSNGELRICLDPRHLNNAVKRTHYKTPTLDEITHKMCEARIFSKLDAKHGYWGIRLDDESADLCTFQSPVGKYKFVRLPFGLCVSQDIFQKHMDDILSRVHSDTKSGVIGIADDFVVYGRTERDHDNALNRLMQSAKLNGLVFRSEKCKIRQKQVSFFGLLWSTDGMRPDPKKCDSIHERPAPGNVSELQSFLGLVQYLAPFVPNLSEKTKLLRQLCKKSSHYEWTAEHNKAFNDLKQAIHKDLELQYYNSREPTVLEVDASSNGLGAALIQNNRPIAFASKSLTDTESRYANIERELLAVVYALEKFHTYVYGKHVTVYSDHKPLESIVVKQMSECPPRLQRMLLRIQPYDVTVIYKPGAKMVFADYLSRVAPTQGDEIALEHTIHAIVEHPEMLTKLRHYTWQDETLRALQEQIMRGWPDKARNLPTMLKPYWGIKDALNCEDGLIFYGERLVIPEACRGSYIEEIHATHQGQTKCILRAKQNLYWPNMTKDIIKAVEGCELCQKYQKSQSKEVMWERSYATMPWEIVHTDIFTMCDSKFILIVDEFTKMPYCKRTKSEKSEDIIRFMKEIFSMNGKPAVIVSDNGPCYSSKEFEEFAESWQIEHVTSSPRYPQSNGFIERMVGYIEPILEKAVNSGGCILEAMLDIRTTPIDGNIPSPATLFFGRQIRGRFPVRTAQRTLPDNIYEHFEEKRKEMADRYNGNTNREYCHLLPNMRVMYQESQGSKWEPAIVVGEAEEPRSYLLKNSSGGIVRRNRRFIKQVSPELAKKHREGDAIERLIQDDLERSKRQFTEYSDMAYVTPSNPVECKATRDPNKSNNSQPNTNIGISAGDAPAPMEPRRSARVRRPVVRYGIEN